MTLRNNDIYGNPRINEPNVALRLIDTVWRAGAVSRLHAALRNDVSHYHSVCLAEGRRSGWQYRLLAIVVAIALAYRVAGDLAFLATLHPQISIVATIFAAASISGIVGFAFSPLAGVIVFQLDGNFIHAVQTLIVASISLQAFGVWSLRKHIELRRLAPLLIGGLAALIPGIVVLMSLNPRLLTWLIGAIVVWYGLYALNAMPKKFDAAPPWSAYVAGALGGLTGPLAGFPGCFVTIWCGWQGWDKTTQRAVYQPYILVMQIVTLAGLSIVQGNPAALTSDMLQYAVPAIAGSWLGMAVFGTLTDKQFARLVAVFLVISGIGLLTK